MSDVLYVSVDPGGAERTVQGIIEGSHSKITYVCTLPEAYCDGRAHVMPMLDGIMLAHPDHPVMFYSYEKKAWERIELTAVQPIVQFVNDYLNRK